MGYVDASASNSSGSGTGAVKFGAVTIGSVGKGSSTLLIFGALAAAVIVWFLMRGQRR